MKTVTLREWGKQLPLGDIKGGKFVRDFELREFEFSVDQQIAKERANTGDLSVGDLASLVLSRLLTKLKGQTLDPDKAPEVTRALLARCYTADVMYLWLWARYESMGKDLDLPFKCEWSRCTFDKDVTFDVGTIDVVVAEKPEDLSRMVKLGQQYTIQGKDVNKFKVQPPYWATVLNTTDGAYLRRVLETSIVGSDKHEGALIITEGDLKCIKRPDYKKLEKEVNDISGGPKLVITDECPKCKRDNTLALDWEYDDFFG